MTTFGECAFDGCAAPVEVGEWGADADGLCAGHRQQRKRGQRLTSLQQRPKTPLDRVREAALTYAEAEADEDFDRADDNLRKSAVAYTLKTRLAEMTKAGIEKARRKGVRIGRPPKLTEQGAVDLLRAHGGDVVEAAAAGQVHPKTLLKYLVLAGKKAAVSS